MLRLFVGIPLPPEQKLRLSAICFGLRGARWVDPGNFHVTLRFIGEVDEEVAAEIDQALQEVRATPFRLTVAGIDVFGSGDKPRLLHAGLDDEPGLFHLHDKIARALRRIGLPPDRHRYAPHVTLARVVKPEAATEIGAYITGHALFRLPAFAVDEFCLIRSYLTKSGSIYEDIAGYKLR